MDIKYISYEGTHIRDICTRWDVTEADAVAWARDLESAGYVVLNQGYVTRL
jgi:DNA-binding MarR family transcriptional regulator